MEHTQSMTRNKDFHRLYSRGKSLVDRNFVIYYRKSRRNRNLLGITVGKKVGNAVRRNRAKRLIRESYRQLEPRIKTGYEIVVVARSRMPYLRCQVVLEAMELQFGSANLLVDAPLLKKTDTAAQNAPKGRSETAPSEQVSAAVGQAEGDTKANCTVGQAEVKTEAECTRADCNGQACK